MFKLKSQFKATGEQPRVIESLQKNLKAGIEHQVLLGVTGSGKTFAMASVIEKIQRPVLIISHNKTLAAQLYQEFKDFFPESGVHYFVSYYDYYQPEAYIPQTDTFIEKDAKINEEIDRLRHATTQDLVSKKDIIVIASVSCIYGLGAPENYHQIALEIKTNKKIKRKNLISHLISLQYQRNDIDFKPGTFRIRGNIIEIYVVTGKEVIQIEFLGDNIEKILKKLPSLKEIEQTSINNYQLFPANFWVTPQKKLEIAIENIRLELDEQLKKLKKEKKLLEAQRLNQRTKYDLELLKETGFCNGIENYSRHLEFRKPSIPPFTLLDYFKFANPDYLVFIDESHMALPQLRAMSSQDKVRKGTLINYGFRLPSAADNRPLTFEEFSKKVNQTIYVSATPTEFEKNKAGKKYIIEQLIRPTGLLEPSIEIRPTENQVQDLIKEIKKRVQKKQRILAITLTKRLAEELSEYLIEEGVKSQYLHSEIKTLERPGILEDLRLGKYDVLVGINLLREGLDLPEVALVAILDADKEGFLRNETTLIQTMGRAARHQEGHAILYADKKTKSINSAIAEIERRRKIQEDYNKKHGISPKQIVKEVKKWPFAKKGQVNSEFETINNIKLLEKEMKKAASQLNFERAAEIRDLIRRKEK